jgi:hypothetical protein
MTDPLEIVMRIKDEASAALQQVADKGKTVEDQMGNMRAAFTAAGAALTGLGLLGLKTMNDWTDAAATHEQVEHTVQQSLQNSLEALNTQTTVIGENTSSRKEQLTTLHDQLSALSLESESLKLSTGNHKDAIHAIQEHQLALKEQVLAVNESGTAHQKVITVEKEHQVTLQELTGIVNTAANAARAYGFSHDEAATAMAKNIQRTHDLTESQKLLQMEMDYATYKGIGLAEAETKVGLAASGAGRIFKEFGIEVSKKGDKDAALGQLAAKLHGEAQAHMDDEIVLQRKLQNSYQEMQIALGEGLLPIKKQFIDLITNLVQQFNDLSPATKDMISQMVLLGTGFALVVGPLLTFVGLFPILEAGFLALSPIIGPAILIIGGLALASAVLYKAWTSDFGGIQERVRGAIAAIQPILASVKDFLETNIPKAIAATQQAFQVAFAWIQQNVIPIVQSVIVAISKFWIEVQPKLSAAMTAIKNTIQDDFTHIAAMVKPIIEAFLQFIKDHWDEIVAVTKILFDLLTFLVEEGWTFIMTFIKVGLDVLSGNWKAVWDDITSGFRDAWNVMASTVQSMWTTIKSYVAEGINSVISAINAFIDQINSIQIHIPGVNVGGKDMGKFDWGGMNMSHLGLVKFDTGGVIRTGMEGGPAWLHDREMILNDQQQSKLFDLLNGRLGNSENSTITINVVANGPQDYGMLAYHVKLALNNSR